MPNGPVSPDAKVEGGAACAPFARSTRMRPALLSATNTSPFGAVRMRRGPDRPEANRLTSKPFGTIGFCSSVRRTDPDGIPCRCGKIGRRQILRLDQPACPGTIGAPVAECGRALVQTGAGLGEKRDWRRARLFRRRTAATMAWIERRMACSWRSPNEEQAAAGSSSARSADRPRRGARLGINLAARLFSSGAPSILHSISLGRCAS